jgi:hypothetical protein
VGRNQQTKDSRAFITKARIERIVLMFLLQMKTSPKAYFMETNQTHINEEKIYQKRHLTWIFLGSIFFPARIQISGTRIITLSHDR